MARTKRAEPPPEKCQGSIRCFGWCERPPTIVRGGKNYCWQHDPERLDRVRKERHDQAMVAVQKRNDALEARWARQDLLRRSGLLGLENSDLEKIVAAGGISALLPWMKAATNHGDRNG